MVDGSSWMESLCLPVWKWWLRLIPFQIINSGSSASCRRTDLSAAPSHKKWNMCFCRPDCTHTERQMHTSKFPLPVFQAVDSIATIHWPQSPWQQASPLLTPFFLTNFLFVWSVWSRASPWNYFRFPPTPIQGECYHLICQKGKEKCSPPPPPESIKPVCCNHEPLASQLHAAPAVKRKVPLSCIQIS